MSNSKLVDYTILSPNKTSPRSSAIKKITIHHMAGFMTVEECGAMFAKTSRQASSNYAVDNDGRAACMSRKKTVPGAALILKTTIRRLPLRLQT